MRGGAVETTRGTATTPDLSLRTDAVTLVRLLQGVTRVDDAIASGRLELDGRRKALKRFVAVFAIPRAQTQPTGAP